MRNKNFEGARQGVERFIHPPPHVSGISYSIASAIRKPPVPRVVPIIELPSASGNIFPITQHEQCLFDLAALSCSVKYRFGKIPGASCRLDFWQAVRHIFLKG
jgi:hypothetical protein